MQSIYFWNGNKSPARQFYETALLQACLKATDNEYGSVEVRIDNTDYPCADDEANIFLNGADILVTVAGNVKFINKQKLVIPHPLTKGLLGYPFPLVFYVNPAKSSLAERVKKGLNKIIANDEFETLFGHYHGDVMQRLNLRKREIFTLTNPLLPIEMSHFCGSLLD